MNALPQKILNFASTTAEGAPLSAKGLLHLGKRAAVDQALSRLSRGGALIRAGHGIYVKPVESQFGRRAPTSGKVIQGLAAQRGEIVVPHGAAVANSLGLTTQVPTREVYLTSGRSRKLRLGAQIVELRHAPISQLVHSSPRAGNVVRALAWIGPEKAGEAIQTLRSKLSPEEMTEIAEARSRMPNWMAERVSELVQNA